MSVSPPTGLLRALFAFMALPGLFAGLVPLGIVRVDPWRGPGFVGGNAVAAAGLVVLLWCARDFFVSGRGTLAPWDPPRRLVVVGLYRFVRNPMYLGVLMLTAGWSLAAGSPLMAVYAAVLASVFHLRVLWYEELRLAAEFRSDWTAYAASVPRWLPRLTRWRQ